MYKKILEIALKAIALAMGVAVIVTGALNTLDTNQAVSMLALGVSALALAALQKSGERLSQEVEQ